MVFIFIFLFLIISYDFLGWADDSIFTRRSDQEQDGEGWKQNGSPSVNPGAFTTGRGRPTRGMPPPIQPRSSKGVSVYYMYLDSLYPYSSPGKNILNHDYFSSDSRKT